MAILTGITLGWWALLAVVIPIQSLISGLLYQRSMRWGFTDDRIGYHHGVLSRRWHDMELIKTQSVTVRRSFFERRRDLATFRLQTAETGFTIPFISTAEAEALRDLVLAHVESTNRSWM